ncbi:MAG: RNA polymerase-binding protein DksA [Rubrivivax sp.]|nr:RNA polymerase-binding protein DksA [Rubrivivax sp.]
MTKPQAKTAAASKADAVPASPAPAKTAAKTATKTATKTVAKAPTKPVTKPAAPTTTKPVAKTVAKAAPKPVAAPAAPPAPVPAAAPSPVIKAASPKSASQKNAARLAPQNQLPTLPPAQSANRFTDRFAPAAPSARALTEAAEHTKVVRKHDPKLANAWKTKPGRDLSVDELLAMPDAEYMNDKQLDFFRAQLQKQKDDLLSNAGETTEHLREDTTIVPDPADRATIEEEHALELRTRDRERKLLKKIAQSLTRLDSGEYGFCDETGEPIGLQRLLARPTATLSLEAQQRRELKQKMFGD